MDKVPYDVRDITAQIKQWCDEVYPTRTRDHMLAKLQEEFKELAERPLDAWEMADVMIIMLDLCDHLGFDIAKIVHHKMDINRKRSWNITKEGILKHVKHS
jgi:predicted house-cleaning noncanonical NTP pyrophosphatase (MazG superfamily)